MILVLYSQYFLIKTSFFSFFLNGGKEPKMWTMLIFWVDLNFFISRSTHLKSVVDIQFIRPYFAQFWTPKCKP